MNTNPDPNAWPEGWEAPSVFLDAIKEPRHYFKIVEALEKIGIHKNRTSGALKRLVKRGQATKNERNFYHATGNEATKSAPSGSTLGSAIGLSAFMAALSAELVDSQGFEPEDAEKVCASVRARLGGHSEAEPEAEAEEAEPEETLDDGAYKAIEGAFWISLPMGEAAKISRSELEARTLKALEAEAFSKPRAEVFEALYQKLRPGRDDRRNEIYKDAAGNIWRGERRVQEAQPHKPSGVQPFAPKPPRTEEEEAAYQEKRERIERNLDPSDRADDDLPADV